jgi:hypothetical protein
VIRAAVGVCCDRLQTLNRDNLIASTPTFECLPVTEVQDLFLVLYDSQKAQTDGLNLFFGFISTGLEYLIAELINVVLCDLDRLAIGAKWNFHAR